MAPLNRFLHIICTLNYLAINYTILEAGVMQIDGASQCLYPCAHNYFTPPPSTTPASYRGYFTADNKTAALTTNASSLKLTIWGILTCRYHCLSTRYTHFKIIRYRLPLIVCEFFSLLIRIMFIIFAKKHAHLLC